MAKIKLQGNASGTGVLTVTAPNTSTDRTITLPDESVTLGAAVGGANGVDLNDNVKARFGTGNDLEIYHDGTDSYIHDSGTGNLELRTNGAQIGIMAINGSEYMGKFVQGNQVELYYNNSKKFETTATGIAVTGAIAGATNLAYAVASGSTSALSTNDSATVYGVTGTHTTYLVTASANSSITNVVAIVSIGTSTSTMRITNLSGSYNTTVTGSGSNIQVTCGFGSSLVYEYRVIQLR